jgi:hypothetical protein
MHPPAPRHGPARCFPRLRPGQWACSGGPAMTVFITPARRRQLPSHASDRRRSWSVTPGIRPAVTLAYSARNDGGGSRAAKPTSPPPPLTLLPSATPLVTPPHGGPPGPRWRRASSEVESKMILMGHPILCYHALVVRSFFIHCKMII